MTLKEAREIYYKASGTLSEVTRQLSLAGVAVIWIFKAGEANAAGIKFEGAIRWSLMLFIWALAFDLLHYAYKSAAWGILHRLKEKQKADPFDAPDAINWSTLVFFWGKVALTSAAYSCLLYGVAKQFG